MIGKLTGLVDAIGESHLIIDVNGVGYEVQASARALRNLEIGANVSLTIDTHVREDAIRLFGFSSESERSWFRTLQTVQGVGAKVALAALGVMSPQDLASAIAIGNAATVEQTPGVGKKLAQRIVAELKDKAPGLSMMADASAEAAASGDKATPSAKQGGHGSGAGNAAIEAISALSNLGYQPAHASQAVATAVQDLGSDAPVSELIKRGLKELAR
ncbi:MAG: Holliday junction branch migration protein RuvA [Hyphomicrobiaceae bacterium]